MRKRAVSGHKGELPPFLVAKSLKPFISSELRTLVSSPTKYKDPRGGPIRIGFEATVLPKICDVWLAVHEKKALTTIQKPVAERAEILMRGLAHVGIIALVDEATGYQEIRDRGALNKIWTGSCLLSRLSGLSVSQMSSTRKFSDSEVGNGKE